MSRGTTLSVDEGLVSLRHLYNLNASESPVVRPPGWHRRRAPDPLDALELVNGPDPVPA